RGEDLHYSDVTNKFLSEDVHQARAWAALYHRDPPAFFGQLDKFLVERNVLPNLRAALDSHHRFHARSAVLKTALEAYHSESWDVFATLAIIQIEGLFLDYCEDLGVDEAELAR